MDVRLNVVQPDPMRSSRWRCKCGFPFPLVWMPPRGLGYLSPSFSLQELYMTLKLAKEKCVLVPIWIVHSEKKLLFWNIYTHLSGCIVLTFLHNQAILSWFYGWRSDRCAENSFIDKEFLLRTMTMELPCPFNDFYWGCSPWYSVCVCNQGHALNLWVFLAHLCILHGGLLCVAFCLSVHPSVNFPLDKNSYLRNHSVCTFSTQVTNHH